jgi:type IV pilus assembly protein PilM
LTSLTGSPSPNTQAFRLRTLRRFDRWLNAMPHPSLVVEIARTHVAAARWGSGRGHLDSFAVEPLAAGSVMASPVETNVRGPDAVRSALERVFASVPGLGTPLALLIPDPVVRVFMLPFDTLPRRADEAVPLLRWRLKKSVPFDMDDTIVSWMRQTGRQGNLEVVTAVARRQIIREYEVIVESLGANAAVVLSSTLAALPLIEERGATLLVRMCGRTMATVIVHGSNLCVYRATEMAAEAELLDPQAMLDEIFPALAYYQDSWSAVVDRARLSGFGPREAVFASALTKELDVAVAHTADTERARELDTPARNLIHQDLDALVGWMMNEGA